MRPLRVIFSLLLSLTLPAAALWAADPPALPAGVDADKLKARLDHYRTRLQLNPAQQEQLRPILQANFEWLRHWRIRLNNEHSRHDRRQLLRQARGHQITVDKQIEPLLTEPQRKVWKEIRAEARAELKAAHAQRSAAP